MSTLSSGPATSHVPAAQPAWVHQLWIGGGQPAIRWRALIRAVLAALLTILLYNVGLASLRWAMPLKLVGVVSLLLTAGAIVWFVRVSLTVLLQLGIKRLVIFLVVLYLIAAILVGVLAPTGQQGIRHWLATAASVAGWPITGIGAVGRAVINTPDAIRFAATGERTPIQLSGVEWVGDVAPTPIVANVAAANRKDTASVRSITPTTADEATTTAPSSDRPLQISDTVRVVGTEGAPLRARMAPTTDAEIAARFPSGVVLRIIDGPQTANGRVWWKVRGDQGEGWCAAEFLTLVQ